MANATQNTKTAEDTINAGAATFKKTVETATSAFGDLTAQSKKNVEALTESAAIATETAQTLTAQAATFAKKAFEDQVATAKKLAGVKTFQEAWDIQSGYAKSAMDQYLAEANRWNDVVTASVAQSWKPLNERFAAVATEIQAR
ncbi:MAG: phasin family protein [Caulobacteraceae bacterium]